MVESSTAQVLGAVRPNPAKTTWHNKDAHTMGLPDILALALRSSCDHLRRKASSSVLSFKSEQRSMAKIGKRKFFHESGSPGKAKRDHLDTFALYHLQATSSIHKLMLRRRN